jgi:hypothetical protein
LRRKVVLGILEVKPVPTLTVAAQFLVDEVQFIAAKPLDVRLTGEEERKLLVSTRTLAELRIISFISSRGNDGIYQRVLLYKCCDCVLLPCPRSGSATGIASMCPDAAEEEHTYNDTITPSRVYNHGLSMSLLSPLAPPIHFTPFRRQVRPESLDLVSCLSLSQLCSFISIHSLTFF